MRFREPIREARSRERTTRCDSVELLVDRFPRLRLALPRVALLGAETPVERCLVGGATLLVKRDDLTSPTLGGNKVRSLELLLAAASPDRRLLTVGPRGSTHALAVALHGARLGDVLALKFNGAEMDRLCAYHFPLMVAVAPYLSDSIRHAAMLPGLIDLIAALPPGGVPPGSGGPEISATFEGKT